MDNICKAFEIEFHGFDGADSFYQDFFPVNSREEAVELNEKYDGFQIETEYTGKKFFL